MKHHSRSEARGALLSISQGCDRDQHQLSLKTLFFLPGPVVGPSPVLSGPLSVTGNPSWVLEVVPNLPQMSHISISFPRPTRAFHTTHGKGCGWGVPFPLVEQRRSHSGALMAPKQPPMMFKLPSVTRLWEDLDPDLSFSHHMGMILIFF